MWQASHVPTAQQAPQRPRPARAARSSSRWKSGAKRSFGGIVRVRARPAPDEHRVDQAAAEADVGEQAAVDVAPLDAEDEPHPSPSSRRWVKAEARGPKHCTGVSGLTVSGVSMPISRTSSRPSAELRLRSCRRRRARTTRASRPRRSARRGLPRLPGAQRRAAPTKRPAARRCRAGLLRRCPMPLQAGRRGRSLPRRYGVRLTLESSVSLIWAMISSASFHSRCQTLRPKMTPEPPASMISRVWLRTVSSSTLEPPERTTRARPAEATQWRIASASSPPSRCRGPGASLSFSGSIFGMLSLTTSAPISIAIRAA